MSVRAPASVLSSLALAFGLAACGSEDEKTADGAVASVQDYLDSFNDGDYADACDQFTDDYADEMLDEWNEEETVGAAKTCSGALAQGAEIFRMFGDLEEDEDLFEIDEISAEVTDDEAVVDVAYKDSEPGKFGLIYDDGEWLIDEELDEEAVGESSDDPEEGDVPDESASPTEPTAVGQPAELGDWTITVTQVEKNADATMAKANEFNGKPRHQFVLFTYEAVYNGDARTASVDSDLTWSFTTGDARVLSEAAEVTPADSQSWPTEVRTGGTAKGQTVFDVEPSDLEDGILSVEAYDEEFNEIFIDFTLD